MKIAEQIRNTIASLPEDKVFGYMDLGIEPIQYQTVAKVLERLLKKGVIRKMSKGLFYKPILSIFGELQPNDEEKLKPYLFKKGKRVAYITGASLYNQMHLTTQMAFKLKIASDRRINVNKGYIKAKSVKSYAEVTEDNYQVLGLLDALKDIKHIPDCSPSDAVKLLSLRIGEKDKAEISVIIQYALYYPPRVRALLGAILEYTKPEMELTKLRESLNPITKYSIRVNKNILPTKTNWQIE